MSAGGLSESVTGTVTMAGTTVDAGQQQFISTLMDLTGAPFGSLYAYTPSTSATFIDFGGWIGTPTAVATVWGFEGNYLPTGGIASIVATGSQTVTLDGGGIIDVDLSISPANLPLTTMTGSVTTPSACNFLAIDLSLGRDLRSAVAFADILPGDAGAFAYGTFTSPLVWGLSANCGAPTGNGSCSVTRSALAGSENLMLTIPAPTTSIVAPADGATVPGTCADFSWTPAPTSVYLFTVAGATTSYTIVLDRTSFRLPFVLPRGPYTWTVAQIAPVVAGVDAVTGSRAAELILDWREALADRATCWASGAFTVP